MTPEESHLLRDLRKLFQFHGVKLSVSYEESDYVTWFIIGPEIVLEMETIAEELKQP